MTESSCAGDKSCMVWSRCKVGTEREKEELFFGGGGGRGERSSLEERSTYCASVQTGAGSGYPRYKRKTGYDNVLGTGGLLGNAGQSV